MKLPHDPDAQSLDKLCRERNRQKIVGEAVELGIWSRSRPTCGGLMRKDRIEITGARPGNSRINNHASCL